MEALKTDRVAHQMLAVIPAVMQAIRIKMRAQRGRDLTVVQFRALGYIYHTPSASLAALAEHLVLTPSSTSALVEGLVSKGLVERKDSAQDRRRLSLVLTKAGHQLYEAALQGAQNSLCEQLSSLSEDELEKVSQAMTLLDRLYDA